MKHNATPRHATPRHARDATMWRTNAKWRECTEPGDQDAWNRDKLWKLAYCFAGPTVAASAHEHRCVCVGVCACAEERRSSQQHRQEHRFAAPNTLVLILRCPVNVLKGSSGPHEPDQADQQASNALYLDLQINRPFSATCAQGESQNDERAGATDGPSGKRGRDESSCGTAVHGIGQRVYGSRAEQWVAVPRPRWRKPCCCCNS